MVTRIYKYIIFTLTLTSIVFLVACVDDTGILTPIEPESGDKVTIEIFTRSENYQLPQTRGWGAQEGNTSIEKTPYVLVFSGNGGTATCIEIVQAVEDSGTAKRYVQLTRQKTGTFRLLILANNESYFHFEGNRYPWTIENLRTYLIDKELSYISNNLLTDKLSYPLQTTRPYTSFDWSKLIPMSYLTDPISSIDENTTLGTTDNQLNLIRGVAKIIFHNNPDINPGTGKPFHEFVLTGVVQIGNTPQQSKIYNYNEQQLDNVELTTIAHEDNSNIFYEMEQWEPYDQINWGDLCYLNETPAESNTYFIIKGDLTADYGSGTKEPRTFYYKMAAIKSNQEPIEFIRNTVYEFKIKKVRGPGFNTVAEAIAAPASNQTALDYEVTMVDLSSHHVISNGYYYLGVSNSKYILYTDESTPASHHAFSISTDYFSTGVTWGSSNNKVAPSEGITCDISTIAEPENAVSPLIIDVNVKFEHANSGWVEIWLGNLTLTVQVEKRDVVPVTGAWFNYCTYYKNPEVIDESTGKPQQHWEYTYYLSSGTVDGGASEWIKLAPGSNNPPEAAMNYTSGAEARFEPDKATLTNVTDMVTSGHGKIQVYIDSNEVNNGGTGVERNGTFYLSTGVNPGYAPQNKVERIKFDIKQLGSN